MPRLEIGSGQQRAFREITVSGSAVLTRAGDADTDGEAGPPIQLDSPAEARAEAARRIAQARADGYEPIESLAGGTGDLGARAFNLDLIDAILDAPDDDAGYLVYGDWLQSVGDPRGELVMLQHKLARKPHDRKLRRAEQEFHKRHGDQMLPPRLREQSTGRDAPCTVDWRCGFIYRVYLSRTAWSPAYTVRELLAALLEHPSAQLLQELIIGPLAPEPPHDFQAVIDTLCAMAPPALRVLELGDGTGNPDFAGVALSDVTCLLSRLPRLVELHLHGDSFQVGALHAPALRSLSLPSLPAGDAGGQSLYAIMRARWPRLQSLALRGELGLEFYRGRIADIAQARRGSGGDDNRPFPLDGLGPLLAGDTAPGAGGDDGSHFPALRHLAITHTPNTADVWRAIVDAPVLGQLDILDLSEGSLGDADVPMMLQHPERLAHLSELHLQRNCISRDHRADIRQLGVTVLLDNQRGAGADAPQLTLADIHAFAPDYRSIPAAREYLDRDRWEIFALWETVFWGRCRGTELYDVFVDVTDVQADPSQWEAACTCPSAKVPCKHALALMYVAERYALMPVQQPPEGFIARCRASRYDDWTG